MGLAENIEQACITVKHTCIPDVSLLVQGQCDRSLFALQWWALVHLIVRIWSVDSWLPVTKTDWVWRKAFYFCASRWKLIDNVLLTAAILFSGVPNWARNLRGALFFFFFFVCASSRWRKRLDDHSLLFLVCLRQAVQMQDRRFNQNGNPTALLVHNPRLFSRPTWCYPKRFPYHNPRITTSPTQRWSPR